MTRDAKRKRADLDDADDQLGEVEALLAVIGNIDHSFTHPRLSDGLGIVVKEAQKRLGLARNLMTETHAK